MNHLNKVTDEEIRKRSVQCKLQDPETKEDLGKDEMPMWNRNRPDFLYHEVKKEVGYRPISPSMLRANCFQKQDLECCDAVWFSRGPYTSMFPRSVLPPSSGSKSKLNKEPGGSSLQTAEINFSSAYSSTMKMRNLAEFLPTYAKLQPRRSYSL
jgi:hypothetical protein